MPMPIPLHVPIPARGTGVSRGDAQPDAGIVTPEPPGHPALDEDPTLDLSYAARYIADVRARVLGDDSRYLRAV